MANEKFTKTWKKYKRNRNMFFALLLLFLPFQFAVVKPLFQSLSENNLVFILTFVWLVLIIVFGLRIDNLKCPKCDNRFYKRRFGLFLIDNPLQSSCIHCGLKKYSLENNTQ